MRGNEARNGRNIKHDAAIRAERTEKMERRDRRIMRP